ncbi:MAG: DNA replication/repair protein RecF [Thermodesulfobacteriota bacterium]
MILKSLTIKDFKSYSSETLSFDERFNLIIGENAQGKTNLLEAIHFLLNFKPFKQLRSEEVINLNASECRLKGEVESDNGFDEVHIHVNSSHKTIKINGKIVYRTSQVYGRYNVVTFLPSDIELIKGSPKIRRDYIDSVISTVEPSHLTDLKTYQRALSQRNAVLSKSASITSDQIEVWDYKLAEIGSKVITTRLLYIDKLKPILSRIYKETSGLDQDIDIIYESSEGPSKNIEKIFLERLKDSFPEDKRRQHTTVGPHRDQISFSISDNDAGVYSSQGEAKNLALALKASEIEIINQITAKTPILLLDDITSELDSNRKKFLFKLLRKFKGQIFITTTSIKEILYKGPIRVFRIKDKTVSQKDVEI